MDFFYWIVWVVGIMIFIIVLILYNLKIIDRYIWYLFWVGFILGLTWEVPLSIANEISIIL